MADCCFFPYQRCSLIGKLFGLEDSRGQEGETNAEWEYLTLWSEGPKYEINGGGERTYMAYENVFKFLNKFGKEGWELVAQPSPQIWTFKRLIEE